MQRGKRSRRVPGEIEKVWERMKWFGNQGQKSNLNSTLHMANSVFSGSSPRIGKIELIGARLIITVATPSRYLKLPRMDFPFLSFGQTGLC
jgi:hypothetical protein